MITFKQFMDSALDYHFIVDAGDFEKLMIRIDHDLIALAGGALEDHAGSLGIHIVRRFHGRNRRAGDLSAFPVKQRDLRLWRVDGADTMNRYDYLLRLDNDVFLTDGRSGRS